jgi:hypothetical protein
MISMSINKGLRLLVESTGSDSETRKDSAPRELLSRSRLMEESACLLVSPPWSVGFGIMKPSRKRGLEVYHPSGPTYLRLPGQGLGDSSRW